MAETICGCLRVLSSVIAGQSIVVVTMNGRYDLRLPQIRCKACEATWIPAVDDLIHNDYWPATSHYSTVYATDVLFSFEEMKVTAPGMSSQAFLRMLDQRTVRVGRSGNITADSFQKSFLEWEAVRFEVDKLCQEDHFDCPACSPDMLAVSVDGNHKHYRFKSAARSLEEVSVEGNGQQRVKRLRSPQEKRTRRAWNSLYVVMVFSFVPSIYSVDLSTKRKAFDIVMAVRRLEEEKRILIAEMNKHWKSLCTRADTLK
ncbi:uncharacterized protein LOC122142195 [Cyprinus carpio]|uniref:Uncharacterized protein LOC122142195 n=1 Tax=Cyprinus carpio TaxID=7962 RepID=A0A9Q9XTR9_CYPCA|nr:uncharacterized protein LOC122142195 [Cyprinus carpio]